MSAMQLLEKIESILFLVIKTIVVITFMVMVVIVFAQVFVRYLTTSALTWSEELSRFLMIWMVFMASIVTYNTKDHIQVDILINALKGIPKKALIFFSNLVVVMFSAFVLIGSIKFLPIVALQKSPANGIIMSYIYVAIPISMTCTGMISIKNIIVLFINSANIPTSTKEGT